MSTKILSIIGCGMIAAVFCLTGVVAAEEALVAKVATTPITSYELNREMQRILPMNVGFHGGISEQTRTKVRGEALQNLLDRGYQVAYAMDQNLSVSDAELDKRLEKLRQRFPSDEQLQQALGNESLEDFYAAVRRQLLADKAEQQAVASKAKVSDAELQDYYQQNRMRYMRPKQYRASVILIKVDPSRIATDKEGLQQKAEDLAKQAREGEDFHNLAYYNSDDRTKYVGGDVGYFHAGQLDKKLEDAISNLQPGDIAGPVETLVGFHIIKLTEVNEPKQMEFDEVQEKIRLSLEKNRFDELRAQWMTQLKERYQQEVYAGEEG